MKGKKGTGDPGGPDAKSRRYASGTGLCPSGEKGFFADIGYIENHYCQDALSSQLMHFQKWCELLESLQLLYKHYQHLVD